MARSMRPFFGYFGGKWRDAVRNYPAPEFGKIIEPFAGSAGYSLRYFDHEVVLVEKDPIVAAVWRYLISVSGEEILSIPDVPSHGTVDDLRIPQEAKWLVGFWLNRATNRPRRSPSSWMRQGIRPGSFWGNRVRATIAAQVPLIRHWKIREADSLRLSLSPKATWFIDPPYQKAGLHYHFGADQIDYAQLAEWCVSRRGQVIVCENEGADWLPFRPLGAVKTTRAGRRSREVVWLNDSRKMQSMKARAGAHLPA